MRPCPPSGAGAGLAHQRDHHQARLRRTGKRAFTQYRPRGFFRGPEEHQLLREENLKDRSASHRGCLPVRILRAEQEELREMLELLWRAEYERTGTAGAYKHYKDFTPLTAGSDPARRHHLRADRRERRRQKHHHPADLRHVQGRRHGDDSGRDSRTASVRSKRRSAWCWAAMAFPCA